ncbi:MAG: response regulator [Nitrososphaeraceae archaeon]|jgi:CheY-like chemotaxis protein
MFGKNNGTLMLLLLPEVLSENLSKNHEIQYHNLFLPSYKVDSRTGNIKKNELKKTSRNSNNDDVLTNARSNSQNRIMIVDDEHDIARLFAVSLERSGFVVDVFNDPLSALSDYKAGLYDLLLLDIRMPSMSGLELYQKIKDIDDKAKVCFITAYEESQNDLKKLFPNLEEVDCFVRKPIEMHNLVKIVKSRVKH